GGATLQVALLNFLPHHLDRVTIIQATGRVTGKFAASQVFAGGVEFSVVYYADHVDLVVNQAPTLAVPQQQLLEDSPLTLTVAQLAAAYRDADGDALAGLTLASLPAHGALTFNGQAMTVGQAIPISGPGAVVYTPDPNYYGDDGFDITVFDGIGYGP